MLPGTLPYVLARVASRANNAAGPAVIAMSRAYQRRVSRVTLRTYFNAIDMPSPAPTPEGPPAMQTGNLARSVKVFPGNLAGPRAEAKVAPTVVYARLQELGGHIYPIRFQWLRFPYGGMIHFRKHVYVPPRPYMRPTTEKMIADGSLTGAAADAFEIRVWGR